MPRQRPSRGTRPRGAQDQRMEGGALSHGSEQGALVGSGPGKRYDVSWACQPWAAPGVETDALWGTGQIRLYGLFWVKPD